ncbi:phytanoyl-CoA dioxygenase family protein [Saccharothrix lopnurensis]|uniref:Phytanoyl-CoA dioxygenase family protein n=1 Tax=Saccharothrix lopnurensis TaxID=1670621 RepID=A0ABW1PDC2_9PSEU
MGVLPFTDSTALRDDARALADRLAEDGYLHVRGLLPEPDVAAVRDHVLALAREAGWLLPPDGAEPPLANPRATTWWPDPDYVALHDRMWRNRDLHALMHTPALLTLLGALFGEPVLVHPRKVLRVVHPRCGTTPPETGWHQDYPGIQGSKRALAVWTPLAPVEPGTGALTVLPGSHRAGLLPMRLSNDAMVGWEADTDTSTVHTGHLDPGDVIIFTVFTVHSGSANEGPRLRLSVDCRYQPVGDPVCPGSLEFDDGKTWDDVYRTWPNGGRGDPLSYYWRRLPLTPADYDSSPDAARDHEVIAAAEAGNPDARRALRMIAVYGVDHAITSRAKALLRTLPVESRSVPGTGRTCC